MKSLFLLLLALPALALDPAHKPHVRFDLEKLEKTYREANSLEADFVQEVYQASLARTKTSTGSLRLKKPASIRWEIYKPEASVMVTNGRKLWYFTPNVGPKGAGQVLIRSTAEVKKQPLFRILTGNSHLTQEFEILKTEKSHIKEESSTKLRLKPKKPMGDLEEIDLRVTDKYLISEIYLKNGSGNTTKISLQNQVLNAKLPPVLFDFSPPPGAEIMKN